MWKYLALVTCFVLGLLWWEYGEYLPKPAEPTVAPEVQVKEAADYCATLGGFDDGDSDLERIAMAVAHLNLAKEMKASTCDVFGHFQTLRSPGNPTTWFRDPGVVYQIAQRSEANLAKYNQVKIALEQYQNNPGEFLKDYPWFSCVTRYIRTTWPWATPWPDKSLRTKMRLVYTSPGGAEFFCPK